jgi:hypothetical protein
MKPPYFGMDTIGNLSNAWDNPLVTKQIHQSHIETLTAMCARRFEHEFVSGTIPDRGNASLPMALGTASHELMSSIIGLRVMPGKDLRDLEEQLFTKIVLPNISTDDELHAVEKQYTSANEAILQYVLHNTRLVNLHDEKPFFIPKIADLIGSNIDPAWSLAGRMDLAEINEDTGTIRIFDYKFRGRSNANRNKSSSQSSMYALAGYFYGYTPTFTYLEVVRGQVIEHPIPVDLEKLEWLYERIRQSIQMLELGIYPMNVGNWWCSPKYCRYWRSCRGRYEPEESPDD